MTDERAIPPAGRIGETEDLIGSVFVQDGKVSNLSISDLAITWRILFLVDLMRITGWMSFVFFDRDDCGAETPDIGWRCLIWHHRSPRGTSDDCLRGEVGARQGSICSSVEEVFVPPGQSFWCGFLDPLPR